MLIEKAGHDKFLSVIMSTLKLCVTVNNSRRESEESKHLIY